MKKAEIVFSSILVPIDYVLLVLAGWSAYALRYSKLYTSHIREVVFSLPLWQYNRYVLVVAAGWIILLAVAGVYSMRPGRKITKTLASIFLACSTGTLIVILSFFFSRELFSSRFIILAAWILSIIYVSAAHLLVRYIQRKLYKRKIGVHRVVFVGAGELSRALAETLKNKLELGYQIVYEVAGYTPELETKIKELTAKGEVDEIIQADPNFTRQEILKLIDLANNYHLEFKYAADLLGAKTNNVEIHTLSGIPLVEIKKTPLDGWGKVAKRVFDIAGSIFFLILFSPLFIIVPILIKLDSPGSILYKSARVGAKGKKFYLYKFRSMFKDADKIKQLLLDKNERRDGPLFKMENDPRITRVGKWLRKTSIDEIPNFWNVLLGNMSLVGPRPHEPHEVAQYQKHHKRLLDIKPGITGMAQVSGRSKLSFETEVKLDTMYIENWSLWLDIIILLKTPLIIFRFID